MVAFSSIHLHSFCNFNMYDGSFEAETFLHVWLNFSKYDYFIFDFAHLETLVMWLHELKRNPYFHTKSCL